MKRLLMLLVIAGMLISAGGCDVKTRPQKQARQAAKKQETKFEKFQRLEKLSETSAAKEAERLKRLEADNKFLQRQDEKRQREAYGDKLGAFTIAQDFVTSSLKCPRTAKWPWISYSKVTVHLGNGRYQISSYLDAQNGFGAMVRIHFVCVVQHISGDRWRLIELKI